MAAIPPITEGNPNETPSEEVRAIRKMLGEAGEQLYHVVRDDISYIIPESDGSHSVYTNRKEVHQIVGIYLSTDIDKTRNLYIGIGDVESPDGGFNRYNGRITLSDNYSYQPMAKVIVDYVHLEGLKDTDIEMAFEWAKMFISHYTNGQIVAYNSGTKEWWAAISVSRYSVLLLLNTGSVLQAGYNLRIEEFALETKAWGEGMIAQFLLNMFKDEIDSVLANVGWGVRIATTGGLKTTRVNTDPGDYSEIPL